MASNQSWEIIVSADTIERLFVNVYWLSIAFKAVLLRFNCSFSGSLLDEEVLTLV